jgi:plasmid stabilization system protein ParE
MDNIRIVPAAQRELDRAYAYYRSHGSQRVADEFFAEVLDALGKIAADPELWPPEDEEHRFFPLARHSYVIYYQVEGPQSVRVVAISHSSQEPGYWKGRT